LVFVLKRRPEIKFSPAIVFRLRSDLCEECANFSCPGFCLATLAGYIGAVCKARLRRAKKTQVTVKQ